MSETTIKTALLSHLCSKDYDYIYEPAEDSFLMIDALEKDLENIKRINPLICLEIGSGTGIVSCSLSKALGPAVLYLTTDINIKASLATKKTAAMNGVNVEAVNMDLVKCFEDRLRNQISLIIFNPPYVVTEDEEVGGCGLSASWAGGVHGTKVMNRLFPSIPSLLAPQGRFYLLIIKENNEDEILNIMYDYGFKSEVLLRRRCGAEQLCVLCFTWR